MALTEWTGGPRTPGRRHPVAGEAAREPGALVGNNVSIHGLLLTTTAQRDSRRLRTGKRAHPGGSGLAGSAAGMNREDDARLPMRTTLQPSLTAPRGPFQGRTPCIVTGAVRP